MGLGSELEHADHFAAYVNELTKVLGHADREKPSSEMPAVCAPHSQQSKMEFMIQ
jgi:hypothetical protein